MEAAPGAEAMMSGDVIIKESKTSVLPRVNADGNWGVET